MATPFFPVKVFVKVPKPGIVRFTSLVTLSVQEVREGHLLLPYYLVPLGTRFASTVLLVVFTFLQRLKVTNRTPFLQWLHTLEAPLHTMVLRILVGVPTGVIFIHLGVIPLVQEL